MKILMVNKFLHARGGAETYMLELGDYFSSLGHVVEYFGMESPDNIVGNRWGLYTASMDFHGSSLISKASYPMKVIYSAEARRKMRQILDAFQPDVVHINNFNYQLTPSILLAAEEYRRAAGRKMPILYTAHDPQLVCPNHQLYRPAQNQICEKCLDGSVLSCVRGKCIHDSVPRSILGAAEYLYWKHRSVYRILDRIICPSAFMKRKLDTDPVLADKTVVLHNYIKASPRIAPQKQNCVLYFGRFSEEKGIRTLLEVCRALPQIPFVFAGSGPLEELVNSVPNVRNLGFLSGDALKDAVSSARFSVCPSEWNENCPFSVLESISLGTPVLGSVRGGIPELIEPGRTGWLFPAGDADALRAEILRIWNSEEPEHFAANCRTAQLDSLSDYAQKLEALYRGE